jgi:hypothetical protein
MILATKHGIAVNRIKAGIVATKVKHYSSEDAVDKPEINCP